MTDSSAAIINALTVAAQRTPAWQSAGATVRFVLTDPDAEVVIDPQGNVTEARPTHVLHISWPDLRDIAAGHRSFLRSVTSERLRSDGPVMQTFAFGQALATFEL
jgi:hypothetical protein